MMTFVVMLALLLSGCSETKAPEPPTPSPTVTATATTKAPGPPAKVVDARRTGRVEQLTVQSPALKRTAKVSVLLPAGWTAGGKGWPVLYLLHGCCVSTPDTWLTRGGADELTSRLRAVVIMPEGGPMGWYTDWHSGPAWETFHMAELRPLVEQRYGIGGRRAIAGFSMGGHGAMNYAARYPGVFEAAAAFSGVLDIRQDPSGFGAFLRANGAEATDIWGPVESWDRRNPADLVDRLKGVRLYVSCGNGRPGPLDRTSNEDISEASLLVANRTFAARAKAAGIPAKTDFYGAGTHSWPYWTRALERALPSLFPQSP